RSVRPQLGNGEARVERRVHEPELGRGEEQVEAGGVVVSEDRDAAACPHAEFGEVRGRAGRAFVQVGGRRPATVPVQRGPPWGEVCATRGQVEHHRASPAAQRRHSAFHTYPTPAATSTARAPSFSSPRCSASTRERIWSTWPRWP